MPKIVSTGIHLPRRLVTNEELYAKFGRDHLEPVFQRIGHGARYHSEPEESSGDHAVKAAQDALAAAEMGAGEIDLLIVATDTPAFLSPATAAFVQHRLGASNAAAFDVNCACAAFVTAVDIAAKYLHSDAAYRTALVVGTYAMSKFLDPDDSATYPLFGDGAGAVLLRKEDGKRHFISSQLKADGSYWDFMGIYGGGSADVASSEMIAAGKQNVRILKKFPASLNKEHWPPLIRKTLEKGGLSTSDIGLFVFTQIRKFTIEQVMEEFGLPMERTHCVMDKWGYTGSACIPMALHDAIAQGKLRRGQRLVLCASGGGYAMACLATTY